MDFSINGKPLTSLRVVDLKVELEKRGLPKSGNKNDLIERLSNYLLKQTQNQNVGLQDNYSAQEPVVAPGVQPPNMSLSHGLTDNDFVRDYLKLRESQFASALSDQDAHLQSSKIEQPNEARIALSGHVESQHIGNPTTNAIQNQVFVEKQDVYTPAVVPCEVPSTQKAASSQEVQQLDSTLQETAQDHRTALTLDSGAKHKASPSPKKYSVEPTNFVDNVNSSAPEGVTVQSDTTIQENLEKSATDAKPTSLDTLIGDTENFTSESSNEKAVQEVQNGENSKEKIGNNVQNQHVHKVEKAVQDEKENAGTPDCDEIVVSHSPILPDFEETIDEEKEKTSTARDESLSEAPPPDTTFRKLSRPTSNDSLADDQKKKKRQWGRKDSKVDDNENGKNADMVSGELLKDIVPDVKPYLEDLGKEDELDHEQETEEDEINGEELQTQTKNHEENSRDGMKVSPATSPTQQKVESSPTTQAEKTKRGSTNKLNPERSCVIEVRNLVRPFTLIQFKELLLRTGKINNIEDGGFWIDKIKSHAIVEYESPDEADETVMALDGVKWPSTNPKTLSVTFSTKNTLEKAIDENNIPQRHMLSKEYSQKMRSNDDIGDQLYKRKYSETEREIKSSNQNEEMLKIKRSKPNIDNEIIKGEKSTSPKPKKHLDDLFRKTKALPCIYWMPKQLKEPKP